MFSLIWHMKSPKCPCKLNKISFSVSFFFLPPPLTTLAAEAHRQPPPALPGGAAAAQWPGHKEKVWTSQLNMQSKQARKQAFQRLWICVAFAINNQMHLMTVIAGVHISLHHFQATMPESDGQKIKSMTGRRRKWKTSMGPLEGAKWRAPKK